MERTNPAATTPKFSHQQWVNAAKAVTEFDEMFVETSTSELFIRKVIYSVLSAAHGMPAQGAFLLAKSGFGKTAILTECYRRICAMPELDSPMPAIYFGLLPRPSIHSLVRDQLRVAKYPFAAGRSFDDRVDLLFKVIKKGKVRAVIIDEGHHLVENNGVRPVQELRDLIKRETDHTNTCLVMGGLPEMDKLRKGDEQLSSRIKAVVPLTSSIDEPEGRSIAGGLLARSPLKFTESAVTSLFSTLELRGHTSQRHFKTTASEAIKIAVLTGSSFVNEAHVAHAFRVTYCE